MRNIINFLSIPYQNPKQGIMMSNIINSLIKSHCSRNNDEKYNQFPYQNPSQCITMRNIINSLIKTIAQGTTMINIINSLIKTHRKAKQWGRKSISLSKPNARHYNEKYNQFPYQIPSLGITIWNIINFLIKPIARHDDE